MKKIFIYGAGSVGRMAEQIIFDINALKEEWHIAGYIDDNTLLHNTQYYGQPVLGGKDVLKTNEEVYVVLAFSNPVTRKRAAQSLAEYKNISFATLIHPLSWISRRVTLGEGTLIYPGVAVDVDITIGNHVIINKNSTLGHDSIIGDYVTISPGVNLGGNLKVNEGVEFGINSSSIQGLEFGAWCKIGSGAAVIKSIPENCTAVGIPAKPVQKKELR